ncbi:MAG: hypothetical protein L6R37_004513 [Teloschistes peruensis]|nr:MAG: hypothetical protein L6R37_004513 [Teloschistes peruensis]
MGLADIVSRARAGSILRSPELKASPTIDQVSEKPPNEKQPTTGVEGVGPHASFHANGDSRSGDPLSTNRNPQLVVRTVPTWVHILEGDDQASSHQTTSLLPSDPANAQVAEHHYHPFVRPHGRNQPPRGRRYDQDREWAPPMPNGHSADHTSRWKAYVNASAYPAITSEGGEIVTPDWYEKNGPDYSRPWMADAEQEDMENLQGIQTRRRVWWKRIQRTIIRSPMIPLVLRSIVWTFSAAALAVAASIHRLTDNERKKNPDTDLKNLASTEMAIAVDAVALVYLLYITYDEYSGKPLGLRSARAKMRLIFLDLFFIVFDSANLSLAFEALGESSGCKVLRPTDDDIRICKRQKTLASVLLIALIAWLLTFSISVFRLVPKVESKKHADEAFRLVERVTRK